MQTVLSPELEILNKIACVKCKHVLDKISSYVIRTSYSAFSQIHKCMICGTMQLMRIFARTAFKNLKSWSKSEEGNV